MHGDQSLVEPTVMSISGPSLCNHSGYLESHIPELSSIKKSEAFMIAMNFELMKQLRKSSSSLESQGYRF
jgi:hypothetical protein